MSTKILNVQEVAAHLPALLDEVARGDEVILVKDSQPVARLIAMPALGQRRVFGAYRGKVHVSADFDAALPEAYWLGQDPA